MSIRNQFARLFGVGAIALFAQPIFAQSAEEHARAMNDIAATPTYDESQGAGNGPPAEPYDPLQSRINTMSGMAILQAQGAADLARLKQDPRYQTYLHGGWEYEESRPGAAPGEYCTAIFWRKEGAIALSGPGDGFDGAMIMFASEAIPTPSKMKMVRATLTQTNASPATVKAFNFQKSPNTPGMGTIAFAVPSPEALMGGMVDDNEFSVAIEGKEVFHLQWHDGLAARDKWARCIAKRKR